MCSWSFVIFIVVWLHYLNTSLFILFLLFSSVDAHLCYFWFGPSRSMLPGPLLHMYTSTQVYLRWNWVRITAPVLDCGKPFSWVAVSLHPHWQCLGPRCWHLLWPVSFIWAILTGVQWYLVMVFSCISLTTGDAECLVMGSLPSLYPHWWGVCSSPGLLIWLDYFLNGLSVFFMYSLGYMYLSVSFSVLWFAFLLS